MIRDDPDAGDAKVGAQRPYLLRGGPSSGAPRLRDLRSCGALIGLCGVIAGLMGSILTAISWIGHRELRFYFSTAGTILLLLTLPMLLIGAACLDRAESSLRREAGKGKRDD